MAHYSQCSSVFCKMLKFLVIGGILVCAFLIVGITGQGKMLGPGKWSVLNIMKCDNDDEMEIKVETNRRKVNRTHDGFNCNLTLEQEIDETYAIRIDICKVVDGGCKDYSTMADDSMINFVKKYAEGNVKSAFEAADLDPPDFPVPAGVHNIKNFLFDYDELPLQGPYGEFMASGYLIKYAKDLACVKKLLIWKDTDSQLTVTTLDERYAVCPAYARDVYLAQSDQAQRAHLSLHGY